MSTTPIYAPGSIVKTDVVSGVPVDAGGSGILPPTARELAAICGRNCARLWKGCADPRVSV